MGPNSLRWRLALLGVLVALVAVATTAFAVQRVTETTIRGSLERNLDAEIEIRDALAVQGAFDGSWRNIEEYVVELALDHDQRIAVADFDDNVLADSEVLLFGNTAALPAQATIVDPSSGLFEFGVSDELMEQFALENEASAVCFQEAGISGSFETDELGFNFFVPEREPTEREWAVFDSCMLDLSEDFDFAVEATPMVEELVEELTLDDVGPSESLVAAPEPLQLFIGYGEDRGESLLRSSRSGGFWLAVLAVLAGAVLLTVAAADRMARPIASLTDAARRMSNGDLGARADVGGGTEIGTLGAAFNDMAESIQAEDRARRTLTTDVAHELRSPLANLRGYLEAIQDGVVEPDEATVASLHEETALLQRLVDDLQQLSLAEAGRLNLERLPTDLGDLVERTIAAHRAAAANVGVDLLASATPGIVHPVDPDAIRRILNNLVANAVRHTPPGGTVEVAASAESGAVLIEVIDSGEGIAAEHLPHLFDRFYRADPSRTRSTGGSGLGLAIAQELARAHGGDLSVISTVGKGSTFRLSLP